MSSKTKPNNKFKYLVFSATILIGMLGYVIYFNKQIESGILWKHRANYFLMDVTPNGIVPTTSEKLVSTSSAIILVEDKRVFSVDPQNGIRKWEYVEPDNQFTYEDKISFENGEVKVLNDTNVLEFSKKESGSDSNEVIDLNRMELERDGKVYKTEGFKPPPFLNLFFMDNTDKYLSIYEADSGKKLWSARKPITQAILRDGIAYIASDGWVYAIK